MTTSGLTGTESDRSAVVLQAEGMVCAQAECLIGDALELMATRAAVSGVSIEDIAAAVVDRTIRFAE